LKHHLHCAVLVTNLAIHVTDLGIEFTEVVTSLASNSLRSPSSRGHIHDLRNLLQRASLEPTGLFSSKLPLLFVDLFFVKFEVLFWSLSDFCLGDFRDMLATLIGGGYRLDCRGVITILLVVVIGSKSGDI
ncbi:unnamed protein product, partial [Prunus brigantina]